MSASASIESITSPGADRATRPSRAQSWQFQQQIGHISRQSAVYFAGTIFTALSGYLFKVYLARVLGAEALGIYALGMTLVGFLGVFNALGLPQSALRFVASYTALGKSDLLRGFLFRSTILLLASNAVLGAVVFVAGPWIAFRVYHTVALSLYLGFFAVIMVSGALNVFLGQVLAGFKDVARRTVITSFVAGPVTIVLTLAFVHSGFGLKGYILAQVVSGCVALLFMLVSTWKFIPKAASSRWPSLERDVIAFSGVALGVGFLEFVMAQADKVLIGIYLNAREVGIYAVACALVAFIPIVLQSVNQIFSPTIAELHSSGQQDLLSRLFQMLTKWILALALPLVGAMIVFAPAIMRMFGRDFEASGAILVIGTLGQLVNCAVGSVGYLLLMSGHQGTLIRIQIVVACLMVLLNAVLIPQWGIVGAAVSAGAMNAVSNFWYLRSVRRRLGLSPYNRSYVRLIPAAAISVILLIAVNKMFDWFQPEWMGILTGVLLAYAGFMVVAALFGLDEDDRLIAGAVWRSLRRTFSPGGSLS